MGFRRLPHLATVQAARCTSAPPITAYLALNDHWYDKVLPIVAAHQIQRGGNVILVQLENEHPKGWGVVHDPYFDHLEAKGRERSASRCRVS